MIHIYTDICYKPLIRYHSKAAIIVKDSHILEVIFKERKCKCLQLNNNYYERAAIIWAIKYVIRHYKTTNIIVYSDSKYAVNKGYKEFKLLWIKGHKKGKKGFKYKFNCLADWISRNGILNWRNYYYRHLL